MPASLLSKKNIKKDNYSGAVLVKGYHDDDLLIHFAKCCSPIPGDDITGFITKGRGIRVHRRDCTNMQCLSEEDSQRVVEVFWANSLGDEKNYIAQIEIIAEDREMLVRDVSTMLSNEGVRMTNLSVKIRDDNTCKFEISIETSSLKYIDSLINKLYTVKDVISVYRR